MNELMATQRSFFESGKTCSLSARKAALIRLQKNLPELETAIQTALQKDLGRPSFESFIAEMAIVEEELKYTLKHLEEWVRPEKPHRSLGTLFSRSQVWKEPLGVVLIIVPFNYPVQLALIPLISAVAAGNSAIIKMSRLTPHTAKALKELVRRTFPEGHVSLVEGGEEINEKILDERFNKIFFTGSQEGGRLVMAKASRNLTPVTLELAGQNPVIVLRDADIPKAARSIAHGRFLNAGQTCTAADHVFVHHAVYLALIRELKKSITDFYGLNPEKSPDYGRIISNDAFERLCSLLQGDITIVAGGQCDAAHRYIAPTVVTDIPSGHPLLDGEIFGPILPIRKYFDINQVIADVRSGEKPLAAYIFSRNEAFARKVMSRIPAGGCCINGTLLQAVSPELPFGGVGHSGMGHYHGKYGFETFSHFRPVVTASSGFQPVMIQPPYTKLKAKLMRELVRFPSHRTTQPKKI